MEKITIAICYDFDKTLATTNMQEYTFIPRLNSTEKDFWDKCNEYSEKNGSDSTLTYMRVMIDECKRKGIKLTHDYLKQMGKNIEFFNGVTSWFDRINKYAESKNVNLEHYLISSGNKEIIEGSKIFKKFTQVFASEFVYDENGIAYWPKNIVNFTLKTQYLFRICKGATELTDETKVNDRIDKKHVEFRNMIYIGDGVNDVPCMTLVKEKGGTAVSVYPKGNELISAKLLKDNRVDHACESDYSKNSKLEVLLKLVIDSCAMREKIIAQK